MTQNFHSLLNKPFTAPVKALFATIDTTNSFRACKSDKFEPNKYRFSMEKTLLEEQKNLYAATPHVFSLYVLMILRINKHKYYQS